MDWSNYGDWEIDHIIPLVRFSYGSVDDADFSAAWALSNLRPLWQRDNASKRRKGFAPDLGFLASSTRAPMGPLIF
jgi:hypothetical protein